MRSWHAACGRTDKPRAISGRGLQVISPLLKGNVMKVVQKGFTLIELMIVVAIIGILAAIALPAYQDYTARSQMSEALTLASGAKVAVSDTYSDKGYWPTANSMAGLASPGSITGKYVQKVELGTGGLITATMKASGVANQIAGKTLVLSPVSQVGSVEWRCKAGTADRKYVPSSCR